MPHRPSGQSELIAAPSRLAAICSRELAGLVGSVILHGSLTLGDYVPGRSDIDLLVIVERSLRDREVERLTRAVVAEQASAPGPVDLRIVTGETAASPTEEPPMELYVRLHPPSEPAIERRHPGERDLVVELSVCRHHGRSLVGPAPREVIAEIPDDWILRSGDAQLADWQSLTDDAEHAELMVLTACRLWRFHEEGIHCGKSAAGAWALARDPSLRAVRDALGQRNIDPEQSIEAAEIARLLAFVRAKLVPDTGAHAAG